ncbi:hypothetical protein BVX99_01865, partial [bacterium F16]
MKEKTHCVIASLVVLGVLVVGMSVYLGGVLASPDTDIASQESVPHSQSASPGTPGDTGVDRVALTRDNGSGSNTTVTTHDDTVASRSEGLSKTVAPDMRSGTSVVAEDDTMRTNDAGALTDAKQEMAEHDPAENVSPGTSRRSFVKGHDYTVQDLPEGELKKKMLTLDPESRDRGMTWLKRFTFPARDAQESLRVDNSGGIYYVCGFNCGHAFHKSSATPQSSDGASETESSTATAASGTVASTEVNSTLENPPPVSYASVPISSPPAYNSRPGASKHIYIDFNGAVVTGTSWNDNYGSASWDCKAWSLDGDFTTFSDSEQGNIRRIYERIAEDYAPFDVNVTTDVAYDPDNTGGRNDIGWLLITPNRDKNNVALPHNGYGGIAYVGVFSSSSFSSRYQPAWVKPMSISDIAEAASHEMGHNLGLPHDGQSGTSYYRGHGSGAISWAPIMGTAYGKNVSQWSQGEYYNYTNPDIAKNSWYQPDDDDLTEIASKLSYRSDDHGNTANTATPVSTAGDGSFSQDGVIERTGEVDVFRFSLASGTTIINAAPFKSPAGTYGGN